MYMAIGELTLFLEILEKNFNICILVEIVQDDATGS